MARDCRLKMGTSASRAWNIHILDEEEDMGNMQPPLQGNQTNQLAQMIASMSMNKLNQSMNQVPSGENQDFVKA